MGTAFLCCPCERDPLDTKMAWKGDWNWVCFESDLLGEGYYQLVKMMLNAQVQIISGPRSSLQHGSVFSSGYVRRELIAIVASIATHVTLKRVTKAVATHVNSEHHVIQEEDSTVVTPVHIHHLPFFVDRSYSSCIFLWVICVFQMSFTYHLNSRNISPLSHAKNIFS